MPQDGSSVAYKAQAAASFSPAGIPRCDPAGARSPKTRQTRIRCRPTPGFFLPVRVLSRLFRRLFLEGLDALHKAGRLVFLGDLASLADQRAFDAALAPLRRSKRSVYAKRPFAGPQAVLAYLSRHTHRVAISNSRLIALDEAGVTFNVEGLPHQRPRPAQEHDARPRRVHPPLSFARAAQGFPPYPPYVDGLLASGF
jgi:hypothetical protein